MLTCTVLTSSCPHQRPAGQGAAASRVSTSVEGLGLTRPSMLIVDGSFAQRARSPMRGTAPGAAYSRFLDDSSTFKWAAPLQPCGDGRQGGSGTCPDVDQWGFQYNASDSSIINPSMHNLNQVQVLHFHAWTAFWSTVVSYQSTSQPHKSCSKANIHLRVAVNYGLRLSCTVLQCTDVVQIGLHIPCLFWRFTLCFKGRGVPFQHYLALQRFLQRHCSWTVPEARRTAVHDNCPPIHSVFGLNRGY